MSKRDFWREFVSSNWGREFVAGGMGGTAGVLAGYPLDTLRIRQQQSAGESALAILRHAVAKEGPRSLYRGMVAPLASVTFQVVFLFFFLNKKGFHFMHVSFKKHRKLEYNW